MLTFTVPKALGQSKIDYVNIVFRTLRPPYKKVVRLNIPMNYAFLMDFLDARNHLDRDTETRLEVELPLARLK